MRGGDGPRWGWSRRWSRWRRSGLRWRRRKNPPAKKVAPKAKGKNTAQKKAPPNAADPLADKAAKIDPVSYHFKLKLHSFDDTPLVAAYYRAAKLDQTAPVVMLVHEKERSSKDFQDSIADLKGLGLAEYLQANGFAVLTFDLRGHGANPRKAMTERDWQSMVERRAGCVSVPGGSS